VLADSGTRAACHKNRFAAHAAIGADGVIRGHCGYAKASSHVEIDIVRQMDCLLRWQRYELSGRALRPTPRRVPNPNALADARC